MKITNDYPVVFNVRNGRQKIVLWDAKNNKEKTIITTPKNIDEFLAKKEQQRKKDLYIGTAITIIAAGLGYFAGKSIQTESYAQNYCDVVVNKETNKILGSSLGVTAAIGLLLTKMMCCNTKLNQEFIEKHTY